MLGPETLCKIILELFLLLFCLEVGRVRKLVKRTCGAEESVRWRLGLGRVIRQNWVHEHGGPFDALTPPGDAAQPLWCLQRDYLYIPVCASELPPVLVTLWLC